MHPVACIFQHMHLDAPSAPLPIGCVLRKVDPIDVVPMPPMQAALRPKEVDVDACRNVFNNAPAECVHRETTNQLGN